MLEYSVKSVEIESAGTGYSVNDQLTIDLDTKDAKLKVTEVGRGTSTDTFIVSTAEVLTGYIAESTGEFVPSDDPQFAMSGYAANETLTLKGAAEGDVDAVFTITSVDENGAITGLAITDAGAFTEDISEDYFGTYMTIDTASTDLIYEGQGVNGILHLGLNRVYMGGGLITAVQIIDAGENTTDEVENPVSVTGGTGLDATFNITLAEVFEEVEVTDVPGTMPKPATEVSYVSYSVSYPELPIDYNTSFTREYPVQA